MAAMVTMPFRLQGSGCSASSYKHLKVLIKVHLSSFTMARYFYSHLNLTNPTESIPAIHLLVPSYEIEFVRSELHWLVHVCEYVEFLSLSHSTKKIRLQMVFAPV
jgi:hypothetical protein